MPSIFLCHTSIDKVFVEKLANDLQRLGIKVWFDKWEIKIGDSLVWKIEEGIRENEYLGIVLSPDAILSEWVKHELSSAWIKQMNFKKVIVLPVLYRDCDMPLFLQDKKYADFRTDYAFGLRDLCRLFGIKNSALISLDDWRNFVKEKNSSWKMFRKQEFELVVTKLVDLAIEYNWSSWIGGTKLPFSICLLAFNDLTQKQSVSVRLDGKTNAYMATTRNEWNPNHFAASDFKIYVGNSINEVEEFVWRFMEDFKNVYGNPLHKENHQTSRFLSAEEKILYAKEFVVKMNWYKGEKFN